MRYKYNTGGRENYYKKINVRDCAVRATAIANKLDYKITYKMMWKYLGDTPRNGVSQKATNECLESLGWKYIDISDEFKTINDFENQNEDVIFRLKTKPRSTHVVAFVDGELNDTWNCARKNPKVLGYWERS